MKSNDGEKPLEARPALDSEPRKKAISRVARQILNFLLFSTAFYLAYRYGMSFRHISAAPFWPPDAVLLCALLLTPWRRWWVFLLATLPIRLLVEVPSNVPSWFLLAVYANDSLKAVLSAALLRRLNHGVPRFTGLQELVNFLTVAVLGVPMLSAFAGAAARHAIGDKYWSAWQGWFLGDALANLLLTPMILCWIVGGVTAVRSAGVKRWIEGALLMAALILVGFEVLSSDTGSLGVSSVLIYLPFPLLLCAAIRFGPRGVSSALSLIAVIVIWNAELGRGPFSAEPTNEGILSLQLFLCVISVPLLCLAVLLEERQRVGESLRETTDQLARTEAFSLVMVSRVGLDGRWLKVPPTLCELVGYSEEELLAGYFKDITHPDDFEKHWGHCQRLIKGEIKSFDLEKRYIHKDGRTIWVDLNCSSVLDAHGRPIHFLTYVKDITQRRLAEEALRESEVRFRNMADNAPVMVWMSEPDGACCFLSQSWYEFTGQTPETGFGGGWSAAIHPDDREITEKTCSAAAENREEFRVEYRLRRKDGEYRWMIDSAKPRIGSQGEFHGYTGSVVDVTETKQAELNTQFINQLDFALSQVADADEIIRLATSRLGEYLRVTSCYVIEVNQEAGLAIVRENWDGWYHDGPSIVGEYRISDYVIPELHEALEAGQAVVIKNVTTDPRTRDFASQYEPIGVGAFISVPALNGKRWEASLMVNYSQARDWRPGEAQLIRDLTARVWPAFKRARAVSALRDSEHRFRQLAENIGAAFFITEGFSDESPGEVLYVSPAYEKIWGRSPESVYQKTRSWLDAVHPEDREQVVVALRGVGQIQFDEEFRIVRPDGEIRWVHDRVFPIHDERGEIYRLAGIAEDITERKQIEEALRESEARYRSVVESQTELICRYLPDTTLTFINDAYCRYFGTTQEALLGTKFLELIPEPAREISRKHVESLIENPRVEMDEHMVLLPDGGIGWQQWVDHAIFDENGKVVEFQAVGRDITERKQIEEERHKDEERLRLALEAGRMGVWEWDMRTDAVKWARENFTILGLAPFSLAPDYQTWADRVHPDDLPMAVGEINRAIAEKGEFRYEYRVIWPGGDVRWVEDRGRPVYDESGQCLKVSGLILDITERKEAEAALRESEDALRKSYARIEDLAGRLIAAQEEERRHIARELHDDLNQQVAALAIGISRIKRQFPNAEAAILEQIVKLREKTDSLSERIRQVSHELHSSILQHAGLRAAMNSFCAEFSDREGIAVTLDIQGEVENVQPDAALCLYRVAQESLRNIARHSGARSAVVALARANGAIELLVSDRGVGFDPAQARDRRGLGLISMEERVKLLHGSLVLTTQPGVGTELKATIPLMQLRREHG